LVKIKISGLTTDGHGLMVRALGIILKMYPMVLFLLLIPKQNKAYDADMIRGTCPILDGGVLDVTPVYQV
jgi:hypothetical protein